MIKPKHQQILAVVLACGIVTAAAGPGKAQEAFIQPFRRQYNLGPTVGKCVLCHEVKAKEEPGRKNLNVYGKAIQADPVFKPLLDKPSEYKFKKEELDIMMKVVVGLEDKDTDGDGATNKEELDIPSPTFPGDPKSVPDAKALKDYREAQKKPGKKKK